MSNMFYLIGYIVSELQINEIENRKVSIITLAVTRSYQNEYGLYDTDFIDVALFGDIAKNVKEFCKKGDLVGVAAFMWLRGGVL